MAATDLPLEIQQQIYSLLDSKSFHNARRVCKWWRFASMGSLTLVQQLQKLPIHPDIEMKSIHHGDLDSLFSQAARRLMFGLQVTEEKTVPFTYRSPWALPVRPLMAASKDGRKLAALNDRTVTLFDITGPVPISKIQINLQDLRDLPIGCPGLRPNASAQHKLALSSDGTLLAVAMDRTIQIYSLSQDGEQKAATRHIADACNRRITGLDFDHSDYMVRIQLSEDGTVLYLGSSAMNGGKVADLSHWKGDGGLKHTFLDSSRLKVTTESGYKTHLSGLQLIRPFQQGYIFGSQQHGGAKSSQYLLGHLKCTRNPYNLIEAADHSSITEFSLLDTFLSSRDYAMAELSNMGVGTWDAMPSAHESPKFALFGDLLIVAERDKKCASSSLHRAQLFLYRSPNEERLAAVLEPVTCRRREMAENDAGEVEIPKYSIAAIPLCIGEMAGEVKRIKIDKVVSGCATSYKVTAVSEEEVKMWTLADA